MMIMLLVQMLRRLPTMLQKMLMAPFLRSPLSLLLKMLQEPFRRSLLTLLLKVLLSPFMRSLLTQLLLILLAPTLRSLQTQLLRRLLAKLLRNWLQLCMNLLLRLLLLLHLHCWQVSCHHYHQGPHHSHLYCQSAYLLKQDQAHRVDCLASFPVCLSLGSLRQLLMRYLILNNLERTLMRVTSLMKGMHLGERPFQQERNLQLEW